MTRRGLRAPWLVVTDGAPGLVRAVEELWPEADRQRCTVHRLRNILAKLPQRAARFLPDSGTAAYGGLSSSDWVEMGNPGIQQWLAALSEGLRRKLQQFREKNLKEASFQEKAELVAMLGITVHPSEELDSEVEGRRRRVLRRRLPSGERTRGCKGRWRMACGSAGSGGGTGV